MSKKSYTKKKKEEEKRDSKPQIKLVNNGVTDTYDKLASYRKNKTGKAAMDMKVHSKAAQDKVKQSYAKERSARQTSVSTEGEAAENGASGMTGKSLSASIIKPYQALRQLPREGEVLRIMLHPDTQRLPEARMHRR